jgi:hypothetical protein
MLINHCGHFADNDISENLMALLLTASDTTNKLCREYFLMAMKQDINRRLRYLEKETLSTLFSPIPMMMMREVITDLALEKTATH